MGAIHDRMKLKQQRAAGFEPAFKGTKNTARVIAAVPVKEERRVPRQYQLEDYEVRNAFTKQKYIIVDHPLLGELALTFPNFLVHADMASNVFRGLNIVAAGFFELWPDGVVKVYGRSESLNKDSRKELDAGLIEKTLGLSD